MRLLWVFCCVLMLLMGASVYSYPPVSQATVAYSYLPPSNGSHPLSRF